MYLLLKELGPKAEENIMAFASLVKDVNGDNEINKANAIRVISGLMDVCFLRFYLFDINDCYGKTKGRVSLMLSLLILIILLILI
jgi:hypothetical protein